jgi:hypothetical protein
VCWLQPAKKKTDVTSHQCLASPPVVKTRISFPVQIALILHQLENGEKQAGKRNKILMERTIVLCHSIRTDTGIRINIIVKIHTATSIHMEIKVVILCIHISLRTMKDVLRIIQHFIKEVDFILAGEVFIFLIGRNTLVQDVVHIATSRHKISLLILVIMKT